ncbi:MAG: glutathione S-transferase family protein [Acidobacteriota bacterium]
MSKLRIYGVAQSRAFRTYWMAEELGLEYESVPLRARGPELRDADYLEVNPNARIPAISDGGFVLWESMAINTYLASKYGADEGLWPSTLEDQALVHQWSYWAMTEIEPSLLVALRHRVLLEEELRDEAAAHSAQEALSGPLGVLDAALSEGHLLGPLFTAADLNVASVLSWSRFARIDLSAYEFAASWLAQCLSRPAAARALAAGTSQS